MGTLRWLQTLARWLLCSLELAPAVALVAAILVDEGPTGEPRATSHFFPVVLFLFDDFAWTCARNSMIFALVVSTSSLVLGVGLRCALDRVWPRGRRLSGAMALSVVAIAPAFLAFGLKGLLLERGSWPPRLYAGSATRPGVSLESWSGILLWLTWIYSAVLPGAALVAIACAPSFRRLDPAWADAARLVGASWLRTCAISRGRSSALRPRAAGLVFLIAMVEPGAALVLGLRRTLAFQIVEAATGPDPFPRTGVWSLMAGVLGLCGWLVFRGRGRSSSLQEPSAAESALEIDRSERGATPVRSLVAAVSLALWGIMVCVPLAGLVRLLSGNGDSLAPGDGTLARTVLGAAAPLGDRALFRVLLDSAVFALEVAGGLLVVAGVVGLNSRGRTTTRWPRSFRRIPALPPLVLGTGVLALPWLVALLSRFLLDRGGDRAAVLAGELAGAIDPHQHPWILMACAVGLVMLPRFFRSDGAARATGSGKHAALACYAAAVHAGASRWRAATLCQPGFLARLAGRFAILWVIAATNLTPALLFSAGEGTLGPAFLALAGGDGPARTLAAALALVAVLGNLAAFAAAYATGAVPSERDL